MVKVRFLVGEDIGLDVAERRRRLVLDAVIECLDNVFLEVLATRVRLHHRLALGGVVLIVSRSEHVHLHSSGHQGHNRVHVLRDARSCVQGYSRPDSIKVRWRDAVATQELAGGISPIHLETLVGAAVFGYPIRFSCVVSQIANPYARGMKGVPGTLHDGGAPFHTTHWSLVLLAAQRQSPEAAQQALTTFCQSYWPPLYTFLRRRGHPSSDAQDLTQGFLRISSSETP